MCGWPAGVGYPPADGELEQATSPEAASPEAVDDGPDHVGVQLDALAGMVARQGQALTPVTADPVVEADEPASQSAQASDQTDEGTAGQDNSESVEEIDPLTAPLAALTGETTAASSIDPAPTAFEPTEPVSAPEAALESLEEAFVEVDEVVAAAPSENTGTAGRSAAILRPAQLLIVATAALTLIIVGLQAVFGAPTGSMAMIVLGVTLITLAAWTGAAVIFLHWISRAHAHVAATAASHQRHGSSMSLLGWFIPIAGFVIGYRVLQDLWTGSDPATRNQTDAAPAKVRSIDIWLLGIVTASLFGYVMPLALGDSALWSGLSALGLMVAAISLASTMGVISAWQVGENDGSVADEAEAVADTGVEALSAGSPEAQLVGRAAPAPEPVSVTVE